MVFDAVIVFLSLGVDIGIVVVNIRARSFTDNPKTKSSIHISLMPSKKSPYVCTVHYDHQCEMLRKQQ